MRKILYIVKGIMQRKKIATNAIIFQLVIGISTLCIACATYYDYYSFNKFVNNSGIENCYYFQMKDKFSIVDYDSNTMNLLYEQLEYIKPYANIYNNYMDIKIMPDNIATYEQYMDASGVSYDNILLYEKDFLENVRFSLKKGNWFDFTSIEKDVISVVVSSDLENKYKYNQQYRINFIDYNSKETIHMNIKVIGVLSNTNIVVNGNGERFGHTKISKGFEGMIMPYQPEIHNYVGYTNLEKIILPKKEYRQEKDIDKLNDVMKDFGEFIKLTKPIEECKNQLDEYLNVFLIIGIIAMILSLISIIGYNTLLIIEMKKEYGVYFLNGCSWGKCVIISMLPNVFITLISSIISVFVFWYVNRSKYSLYLNRPDYLLIQVMIIIIVFLILTSIEPLIRMIKQKPINLLRECDKV